MGSWSKRRVALLLLVAAAAGGCHGSTPSASRSTPARSNLSTCAADHLSASFRAEDGSTGHYHGALTLRNAGLTTCRLFTTVALQMVAADGRPLETSTAVDASAGRPTAVALAPMSRGSMQVSWVEISSAEPCATPAWLQVAAPRDPHPLVVRWPGDHDLVCGHGVLTTQPARLGTPRV
jgi:hypothetical protein